MEEELAEQTARRNRVETLLAEVKEISDHYQSKLEVYDRIMTWCTDLMDDLMLIDFEALEISQYRRPVHEKRSSIETCWRRIEVCYGNITRDAGWVQRNVDSIQPDMVELWWLMTEDVQKRLLLIKDYFIQFFELYVEFKELVHSYSEKFKDDPHFIFEKYRHFQ
ncbi:hypothetical protein AVEN_110844-1 [Araneus ventricosus]|uniref:Uncharacterized protein n=1 Tax=Araneus ventricosus TaxID=182803 RepID=A0A4Y2N727_ARAVE|nr:hypothetical protein AVEN_110844-1 [Araneus ventricosus]